MKNKSFYIMFFFVYMIFTIIPASAALTIFTSRYGGMEATRTSWLTAMGISNPETSIDFESGFLQDQEILGTTLSGGLIISSTSGYGFVTSDSNDTGGSNPLGTFALAVDEGDNYNFKFNTDISYFSFYMLDQLATSMTINYEGGTSENITIEASGAGGFNGTFLGLIFDMKVSSLYIPSINGGDGEVGIDNIEYGANPVPIPSTIALLGIGLLSLSRLSRKKEGKPHH